MSVHITVTSPLGRVEVDLERPEWFDPTAERAEIDRTIERAVAQIRRAYEIPEVRP